MEPSATYMYLTYLHLPDEPLLGTYRYTYSHCSTALTSISMLVKASVQEAWARDAKRFVIYVSATICLLQALWSHTGRDPFPMP